MKKALFIGCILFAFSNEILSLAVVTVLAVMGLSKFLKIAANGGFFS